MKWILIGSLLGSVITTACGAGEFYRKPSPAIACLGSTWSAECSEKGEPVKSPADDADRGGQRMFVPNRLIWYWRG